MTLTDMWLQNERVVAGVAHDHCRRYRQDWDETFSEACLLFVRACLEYDGMTSSLPTWITLNVRNGLLDWTRRNMRRERGREPMPRDVPDRGASSLFALWRDGLVGDVQTIVGTVLDTPRDVFPTRDTPDNNAVAMRVRLRFLLREAGWDAVRVRQAFRGTREQL